MERFTIVIVTADRAATLAHTLESCLEVDDAQLSILISDNQSSDATPEIIATFEKRDSRVRGIRTPQRLSMSGNYEFALSHVGEGFVIVLGGDDAILPGAIRRARHCLERHPSARVIQGQIGVYYYPDVDWEGGAGQMFLRLTPDSIIRSAAEGLRRCAQVETSAWELPMIYHMAFVHTSVLKEIVEKSGRLIHSITPDYFAAIAVATVVDEVVWTCPGFVLSGVSPQSNGMSQLLATAERDQETRFLKESEFGFHPRVPYVRSRYVIMGEAILRAIDAGLLPADYEIRWDRVIRRAYTELLTGGWSESDVKQAVEALRVLSQNMGCPEVMVEAESASPPRALAVNHPEVLVAHEPPWEWILATQPLGIEGVHDAARLAEGLIAWMEGNATDPRACRILENGVLGGILREGSRQLGELRGGMQIEAVDRERANIQWAKTKTKLEGARQKQTELKDKVEALRAERSRPKTLLGRVSQKLFKRKQSR